MKIARLMGVARMTDLMLTGRVLDAEDGGALQPGPVPGRAGGALDKAREIAHTAAGNAWFSNYAVINALPRIQDMAHDDGLFVESIIAAFTQTTPEATERLKAFLEKRAAPPRRPRQEPLRPPDGRRPEPGLCRPPDAGPGAVGAAEPSAGVAFGALSDLAGFMLRLTQVQVYEAFFAELRPPDVRPAASAFSSPSPTTPASARACSPTPCISNGPTWPRPFVSSKADGLIERRVPPSDRRAVELHLTRAGHHLVRRVLPAIQANDRSATAALSDRERETLMRLLRKLAGRTGGA